MTNYGVYEKIEFSDALDGDGEIEIRIGDDIDFIRKDGAIAIIKRLAGLFDIKLLELSV